MTEQGPLIIIASKSITFLYQEHWQQLIAIQLSVSVTWCDVKGVKPTRVWPTGLLCFDCAGLTVRVLILFASLRSGNDLLTRQDSQLQPQPPAGQWGSGSWRISAPGPSRNTWTNRRNGGRRRRLSWRRSPIMAAPPPPPPPPTLTQSLSRPWPHFWLLKQPRTRSTTGRRNVYQ